MGKCVVQGESSSGKASVYGKDIQVEQFGNTDCTPAENGVISVSFFITVEVDVCTRVFQNSYSKVGVVVGISNQATPTPTPVSGDTKAGISLLAIPSIAMVYLLL